MGKRIIGKEAEEQSSIDEQEIVGTYFKVYRKRIPKDYQVLIGFSGYGNVGYLAVNHLIETLELETIGMWGNTNWYYKGRLESLVTLYAHHPSKTLILASRYPLHVTKIPHEEWEELALEVLSWECKAYYIIAGLREDTRSPVSTQWIAYAPTLAYTKAYGIAPTMGEKLTMIGPLSTFLAYGTSLNQKVLGVLIYCNFDEDPEAALIGLEEIERLTKIKVPSKNQLISFDYSFLNGVLQPQATRYSPQIEDLIDKISDMDPDELDLLSESLYDEEEDDEDEDDFSVDFRHLT